jgi:gas vesicle protein
MRKLTILTAGGIGYVLGAKAGRTRYEQIRSTARRVAGNPQVQKAARHAQETVQHQAPAVKEKVAAAADKIRPHSDDRAADAAWKDPAAPFPPMTG